MNVKSTKYVRELKFCMHACITSWKRDSWKEELIDVVFSRFFSLSLDAAAAVSLSLSLILKEIHR